MLSNTFANLSPFQENYHNNFRIATKKNHSDVKHINLKCYVQVKYLCFKANSSNLHFKTKKKKNLQLFFLSFII